MMYCTCTSTSQVLQHMEAKNMYRKVPVSKLKSGEYKEYLIHKKRRILFFEYHNHHHKRRGGLHRYGSEHGRIYLVLHGTVVGEEQVRADMKQSQRERKCTEAY